MHPAFSVIFFTTASGAGFGLFAWMGLLALTNQLPGRMPAGIALVAGAILATAGLFSSVAHLGQPTRAWRAFSQWRSSWLSREGVLSVATYGPAGLLALLFTFFAPAPIVLAVLGIATAIMCVLTVIATGMIYRSLKPIPAWSNPRVVPNYLLLALATGAVLADAVLLATQAAALNASLIATAIGALGLIATVIAKRLYWHYIDTAAPLATAESATGLGALGKVRLFEAPHTQDNYLLKEMGYRIARKHSLKLRGVAQILLLLPALLVLLGLVLAPLAALAVTALAVLLALPGALIERWLFFAEAKHTVTLYYGTDRV